MKILLLFIFITSGFSSEKIEKPWIRFMAGSRMSSQLMYRGAVFWEDPTLFVGPSFVLWNKLSVRGPNLEYSVYKRSHPLSLKISANYVTDNEPGLNLLGNGEEDFRNQRKDAVDLKVSAKYKLDEKRKFTIGLDLSRECIRYRKYYLRASASMKLPWFFKFETFASMGERGTNAFTFGPTAVGGISIFGFALKQVLPGQLLPWSGAIITNISHTRIVKKANQNADYIRGRSGEFQTSLALAWNFANI